MYLTKVMAEQMLSYLDDRDREGWYYGRKDYFEKNHECLKKNLENIIESFT